MKGKNMKSLYSFFVEADGFHYVGLVTAEFIESAEEKAKAYVTNVDEVRDISSFHVVKMDLDDLDKATTICVFEAN